MHSRTCKGENQYKSRLEDIRILKIEIKKLRREKNILSHSVANIEDLRFVLALHSSMEGSHASLPQYSMY